MAYSQNLILNPGLGIGPFQSMATYQTSGCSARVPVKRYFRTGVALKRLGIEWCNTTEYTQFGLPTTLYGG